MSGSSTADFDTLYRDGFPFVYRVLRYLGVGAQDLEDLAHDVFVVVHRRLGEFDPSRPLRPWLFGISYRTVRRHRERFARRQAIDAERPDVEPVPPSTEEIVATKERWQRLQEALLALPLEQRAVVIGHDLEEESAPALAAALEIPVNTVYSRLRLGRKRLAQLLCDGGAR